MGFDKYYDKNLINQATMNLDEFIEKLKEANGSFISELHSKFAYRTKDELLKLFLIFPSSSVKSFAQRWSKVVLPPPLGPTILIILFSLSSKFISFKICVKPK